MKLNIIETCSCVLCCKLGHVYCDHWSYFSYTVVSVFLQTSI